MPQERSGYNNLTIAAYSPYSLTPVVDTGEDLPRAQGLTFDTFYPGGIFGPCAFTLPRDVFKSWPFKQQQRLVIRNGLAVCWEGMIINPGLYADGQGRGRLVNGAGYWGQLLGISGWRKPWADVRIDPNTWVEQPEPTFVGPAKCSIDRLSRIKFIPKNVKWNLNDTASVRLTAPTGETIKRVKLNYDVSTDASLPPSVIIYFQVAGTTYTKRSNLYDGSTASGATIVAFITTDFLYIGMNAGDTDLLQAGDTAVFTVTMGATVNAIGSVMTAEYWVGNPAGGAWTALTITDNTITAGKTLAKSGTITFTKPGDMGATALADANKTIKIWVRLKVSVNLTANIIINEIAFGMVQNWNLALTNPTDGATDTISSTSTGSIDRTFVTPSASCDLRFYAGVQQIPFTNGSVYASVTGLTVYTVTDNPVTPTTVVKNWASHISNINADQSNIATAGSPLTVEPWITGISTNDYEMATGNISRLAAFGDAGANAWAAYMLESDAAATPAGTPVLAFQQYLALSDYDYTIRLDDPTLLSFAINETDVFNWIVVSYVDGLGVLNWATPTDNAALTDTTSSTTYGRREKILSGRFTSLAAATNFGQRYLAQNKDKHYYVAAPIPVVAFINGKNGNPVPASQVRAGKRIQIANILTDEVGLTGAGLTFTISATHYDDASETVQISCSVPDNLAVLVARLAAGLL